MTFESDSSNARKSTNTLTYNPIGGGIHSDDEWIDINSFKVFNDVTKNWIKKL